MSEKRKHAPSLQIIAIGLLLLLFMLIILSISAHLKRDSGEIEVLSQRGVTVVIDAGHGGEDGGTSSESGVLEKELNLTLAKKLEALFSAAGINVVMTRNDDKLLYDPSDDYMGRKKILDMQKRVSIVSECENPVFVSIHMNAFPEEKYSGLQVYYSLNDPKSERIADRVQNTVHSLLQEKNDRKIKKGRDIFLLDRISAPAILIECGFLSNRAEAEMLSDNEYQDMLAFCIFLAVSSEIQ